MRRCKITVLRREFYQDLADEYVDFEGWGPCPMCKEGDVFYTSGMFGGDMPEGFCIPAWDAIQKHAVVFAYGGKAFGYDKQHIVCCNDGVRPVIFKLEPYEDDVPDLVDSLPRKKR